jgi:hypothetical protein
MAGGSLGVRSHSLFVWLSVVVTSAGGRWSVNSRYVVRSPVIFTSHHSSLHHTPFAADLPGTITHELPYQQARIPTLERLQYAP